MTTSLNQEIVKLNNEIKQVKIYEDQIEKGNKTKNSDQPLSRTVKKAQDLRNKYFELQIDKENKTKNSDQPFSDTVKKAQDLRNNYFELQTEEKTISKQVVSLKEEVKYLNDMISALEQPNAPTFEVNNLPKFKNVIQHGREERITTPNEQRESILDSTTGSITPQ